MRRIGSSRSGDRRIPIPGGRFFHLRLLPGTGHANRAVSQILVVLFQILRQLPHGGIPLLRVKGAGFQDDSGQLRGAVDGGGDLFSGKTAILGFLTLQAAGDLLQRQEGQRPLVHHPVHDQTQGVDVRRCAVVLPVGDLRGHVAVGTGQGACRGFFGHLGDAEVPQLEPSFVGHQNVFRLDVPVDDIALMAAIQRAAQIQAQADHPALVIPVIQPDLQGLQQLHADIDVPADAVIMLDRPQILAVYHIGIFPQLLHEGIFPHQLLHLLLKVGSDAGTVIPLGIQFFDFPRIPGNRQLFQGCPLHRAVRQGALYLIHPAEAALAQLADHFPPGPGYIYDFLHQNHLPLLFILPNAAHNDRDIVPAAVLQGSVRQRENRGSRIAVPGQDIGDFALSHHIRQAVAAQQILISLLKLAFRNGGNQKDFPGIHPQMLGQRRLFSLGHGPFGNMILGELRKHMVTQPIAPAVADIAAIHLSGGEIQRGKGGSHAAGQKPMGLVHHGGVQLPGHFLQVFFLGEEERSGLPEELLQLFCCRKGGHFAIVLPAHTVKDSQTQALLQRLFQEKRTLRSMVLRLHAAPVKDKIVLIV